MQQIDTLSYFYDKKKKEKEEEKKKKKKRKTRNSQADERSRYSVDVFYRDKHALVETKMVLVAAPANGSLTGMLMDERFGCQRDLPWTIRSEYL